MMKKNFLVCTILMIAASALWSQSEQVVSPDKYKVWTKMGPGNKEIVAMSTPVLPPKDFKMPKSDPGKSAVLLSNVPAYDWSFGCSATTAAMMAGYYDRNGFPSVYTGPTNGGLAPLDNSSWGSAWINGEERKLCPLSATRQGLDGRSTRGHVDDYWIVSGDPGPDPFVINGWTEHNLDNCTGDFMRTNQAAFGNSDGSTIFVYYVDGSPFGQPTDGDGCYGLRQFFESKGCPVFSYYNQYINGFNGNTLGFTFSQYCDMIDRGRPVMIQVSGHTMLGMGYDAASQTVYLHDTWDYNMHEMVWGDSYAGMQHYGVGVIEFPCDATGTITEEFAYSGFPACWQQSYEGGITSNRWYVAYSGSAGGSPNEMQTWWTEGIGISRLISPPVNLNGMVSADLSFITFFDDWGGGATLKIQSSSDLINWIDEGWIYATGSGDIPAGTMITATITQTMAPQTYVAWVIDGDHYQFDSWTIDNVSLNTGIQINLKAFLQGPFSGSAMSTSLNPSELPLSQPYNTAPWDYSSTESVTAIPNVSVVDWVMVELRETSGDAGSATASTIIGRRAGFILSNGIITDPDGSSPLRFNVSVTQNLFVVLYHRNHLPVISAVPVPQAGSSYEWDFSVGGEQVYGGTDCITGLAPGIVGLIGGNGITDLKIDNNDKNDAWLPANGSTGYQKTDYNMDGMVNATDKILWKTVAGKAGLIP